jgi:putative oxidoreductase
MKRLFQTKVNTFQVNLSLLLLRLSIGGLMLTHGWPKLMRLLEGGEIKFADPIGLGPVLSLVMTSFTEVGCSILIMLGLGTRIAAFGLGFTMFVAVFIVHANDPFAKMELGLLYFLVYLVLLITGSGKFSLDRFIK